MTRLTRQVRGLLIRAVLRRWPALIIGLVLLVPAATLMAGDLSWETPLTDGLSLVFGATGAAFILAALGGRRPDWIE